MPYDLKCSDVPCLMIAALVVRVELLRQKVTFNFSLINEAFFGFRELKDVRNLLINI
jgi:hypothetical protein